ncbi:MAG: hypothetical protein IJ863_05670 [Spirochaetales bacterium]|nr:hypothetical protein [Spirochaetales bacterium]
MQNPFTTTFSKIPSDTYIPTEQVASIIENFSYENPSESVFKITGVRGSGKTVLLAKIEKEISEADSGWIICRLSPARDLLLQMASILAKEGLAGKKTKSHGFNISASVFGTGGGFGITEENKEEPMDIGIAVEAMLVEASRQGKKILVGIDEVSKNREMEVFALELGKWLRAGYPVYLVCTGLYENIEQLSNVKNLTFFRRATTVQTKPLNFIRMVEMYSRKLSIPQETAKLFAATTKGYAYAFQELGVLAFKKLKTDSFDDITSELKAELFSYAYEKIWEETTPEEKNLLLILSDDREFSRQEIMETMKNPQNYSVYRDRLLRKGLINANRGTISLALPFFGSYMEEYCR